MDRRQIKTRNAIFTAFISLLSKKNFNQITVGEIIDIANIGRATFYAHFETKDYLLKELLKELFEHIFEAENGEENAHNHIFDCDEHDSVFLHLLIHLQNNDNNILELLSCQNNELFLGYFRDNLKELVRKQLSGFKLKKPDNLPDEFWINYIASSFVETIRWWVDGKMKESPDVIHNYFFHAIGANI